MKKKIIKTLMNIVVILLIINSKVYATEVVEYTNENGVVLTQKEYDFVNIFYGEKYFEKMTIDDYEWIKDLNINTNEVEIQTIYDYGNNLSRTTSHATSNKNYQQLKVVVQYVQL